MVNVVVGSLVNNGWFGWVGVGVRLAKYRNVAHSFFLRLTLGKGSIVHIVIKLTKNK